MKMQYYGVGESLMTDPLGRTTFCFKVTLILRDLYKKKFKRLQTIPNLIPA